MTSDVPGRAAPVDTRASLLWTLVVASCAVASAAVLMTRPVYCVVPAAAPVLALGCGCACNPPSRGLS